MDWLLTSIQAHPTYWTLGAYILFSNAVSSMPMPDAASGKFYGFLFKFFNGVASNVARSMAAKIPSTEEVDAAKK